MVREKLKWRTHEGKSTDAEHRGGPTRSSVEVSVMGMERRGWIICICTYFLVNQKWEEPRGKATLLETAIR
jgi:hypothetical protein